MAADPIQWHTIFYPALSWTEKAARPVIVYCALLVIIRVGGKRALQQATLFDFLVLLLISNIVQNAMIGDDNSILGALLGTVVVLLLSIGLNRIASRSKSARAALEGKPEMLVKYGKLDDQLLLRHGIGHADLLLAIRKQGLSRVENVGFAILELDGSISIIERDKDPRPHTALPDELAAMDPSGANGGNPDSNAGKAD